MITRRQLYLLVFLTPLLIACGEDSVGEYTPNPENNNQLNETPVCGNRVLENGEECEDGNTNDGDGCSGTCIREGTEQEPVCGNEIIEAGEICDDGNTEDGDECSSSCQPTIVEDDTLQVGETCVPGEDTCAFGSLCARIAQIHEEAEFKCTTTCIGPEQCLVGDACLNVGVVEDAQYTMDYTGEFLNNRSGLCAPAASQNQLYRVRIDYVKISNLFDSGELEGAGPDVMVCIGDLPSLSGLTDNIEIARFGLNRCVYGESDTFEVSNLGEISDSITAVELSNAEVSIIDQDGWVGDGLSANADIIVSDIGFNLDPIGLMRVGESMQLEGNANSFTGGQNKIDLIRMSIIRAE